MKFRCDRTMRMLTNADRSKRMCRLLKPRNGLAIEKYNSTSGLPEYFESISAGASPATGTEIIVIN